MLPSIDRFVDGAAVKRVGALTFAVCQAVLDGMTLVPEGRVCTTILQLYNTEAIVVEPAGECGRCRRRRLRVRDGRVFRVRVSAFVTRHSEAASRCATRPTRRQPVTLPHSLLARAGALSIAALEDLAPQLAGKKVVCIVSVSAAVAA